MVYHSLKRKELQALCKEHDIPANSANSVLADKLSALLNEKPKPKTRQRTCMKSSVETTDEGEPAELKRQAKKVRFSPNNDLVEYELRPGEKQKEVVTQTKTRRKSVAKKVDDSVDDNSATVELNDDGEQIPVKVTRSRVQSSVKEVVSTTNEKKKGRRGAKDVKKETVVDEETEVNAGKVTRSKAKGGNSVDDNNTAAELNDDSGQIPVKVTRSRVQSSVKEVVFTNNEKKKDRRGAKDVEKETVVDKETEVNVGKVTRSKGKDDGGVQLTENKQGKGKRVGKEVNKETETVEGTVAARVSVTRKAQTLMEGGTVSDANPKKKSGKQVKTEEQNVEPTDVPVRATRSRRQTIKEDIENTVTNNTQTEKKRTRREMKATDLSNNSSHIDKQEPPKRKSFRTRGVETVVEDECDKKEVANKSRVTRSNAPLAKETSGRNKNKVSKVEIQQPVEPLKHEGKKNVNRRKSVLQTEKVEEAVKHPIRTNTRRKSVVQKASKTVESPTVGKNQSKGLSGSFEDKEVTNGTPRSLKQRGTPIKDRIVESPKGSTRSASRSEGKFVAATPTSRKRIAPIIEDPIIEKPPKGSTRSANRSEGKPVAETPESRQRRAPIIEDPIIDKSPKSATRSASRSEGKSVAETPKSRKRKGTPIIEKSTKSSTRSVSKSEGKSVAKKQVGSSLKKPMSKGRSFAVRSGALIRDSRSKKKARLSEIKQTAAEDHTVNSGKEWTPVAKMKNLKLDEEVSEPEVTPAIDKSCRRFTRSTIKEQPITEAQLFSPKVAHSRHDPSVNTAPGRITRKGAKHDGNAAGSFSEKVGKKKQTLQSAHKKPLDDAEVASPKVTEARPTTGIGNVEVQSEFKQPDAQVQLPSPEVAEVGLTSDVGTTGDQTEVKQPIDEVQTSAPEVAEVVVIPDVDTVGAQSEVEQPLDDVQMSSPEVAEAQPNSDGDTIAEVKQPFDEVQMSAPEVADVGVTPDVDTTGIQSEVEQPLDDVQMSSPEVAEAQPNSVGDTIAEVKQPLDEVQMSALEIADVGVTPDVAIGVQSEVEKHLDGVQMSLPVVAEVQPNSDGDTIGVGSEISKDVTGQTLGDLSASESSRLPTIVVEENIVSVEENASVEVMEDAGTAQTLGDLSASESSRLPTIVTEENIVSVEENVSVDVMEDAGARNEKSMPENLFGEKQQNPPESCLDTGIPLGKNLSHTKITPVSMADVAETVPVMEDAGACNEKSMPDNLISGKRQNPLESRVDAGTPLEKNLSSHTKITSGSMADVAEPVPVQDQNEEVYVDPGLFTQAVSLEESGRHDATEKEMESTESGSTIKEMRTDVMIEEPLVSVGLVEEAVDNNWDTPLQISSVDKNDVVDDGEQYNEDANARAQKHLMSEPDKNVGISMIGKDDVQDDDANVRKELNTGSELLNANKNVNVDIERVRVLDDNSDVQDGESEHNQSANDSLSEHNQLASNNSHAIDADVGGDDSEPDQNENVPVVDEVLVKSCDKEPEQLLNENVPVVDEVLVKSCDKEPEQSLNENVPVVDEVLVKSCDKEPEQSLNENVPVVDEVNVPGHTVGQSDLVMSKDVPGDAVVKVDALDKLVVENNKDVVSSILGDTYDMDDEGDNENGQNLSGFDEGFQSDERRSVSSDKRIEQTKEEASAISYTKGENKTSRWNDITLDDEQAAATYDDLDSSKSMEHEDPTREEASPISYTEGETTIDGVKSGQLMGEIGAHESLITQDSSPITYKKEDALDDTQLDMQTAKEDDINNQDEPRSAGTFVDWGEFGSTDVEGKGKTDDQDLDFQTSARTSSIEESFGLAADLTNSVRKLEKDFRNADDGNSKQVGVLKESENSATKVFNWSDSSPKSLSETPVATQTTHVTYGREDAVGVANQYPYLSMKLLFTLPATTQKSHEEGAEEEAPNFINKDHYSSLKSLSTAPATSRMRYVNDSEVDVSNFRISDAMGNENIGSGRTEAQEFSHQWDNDQSKYFGGETQGNAVGGTENEIDGVPSFEDFNLFEDEVVGPIDRPESNTQFGSKQFEFSSEAAETTHHDHPSGLTDNLTCKFEKEVTQMKVPKADDESSFDTGHA